jgi:hypothetical protein
MGDAVRGGGDGIKDRIIVGLTRGLHLPSKVIKIERAKPRPGGSEEAIYYPGKGYQLRPPDTQRAGMNKTARAKFVMTLDAAAELIAKGYDIRMGRPGVGASYIAASGLVIVR